MKRKLYIAPPGTYSNPSEKSCFKGCMSCGRCEKKGDYAKCRNCSGRHDDKGQRVPVVDDYCRCAEGIMQWVTDEGKMVGFRYRSNPYAGTIKYETQSGDESDWESYLNDTRERLDDPNWDPIQFNDGQSADEWTKKNRHGK